MLRRGKEQYSLKYGDAIRMYNDGTGVKEIAVKLGVSYSCVYHWVKGLRKPEAGNPSEFVRFVKENGPVPVLEVKARFPKHNELFLICSRRSMGVKRAFLGRKFLEYSTWYYTEGQEKLLEERISSMLSKVKGMKKKLKDVLGGA